jgi:hypothetical protein
MSDVCTKKKNIHRILDSLLCYFTLLSQTA